MAIVTTTSVVSTREIQTMESGSANKDGGGVVSDDNGGGEAAAAPPPSSSTAVDEGSNGNSESAVNGGNMVVGDALFDHAMLETLFFNEMMDMPIDALPLPSSVAVGGDDNVSTSSSLGPSFANASPPFNGGGGGGGTAVRQVTGPPPPATQPQQVQLQQPQVLSHPGQSQLQQQQTQHFQGQPQALQQQQHYAPPHQQQPEIMAGGIVPGTYVPSSEIDQGWDHSGSQMQHKQQQQQPAVMNGTMGMNGTVINGVHYAPAPAPVMTSNQQYTSAQPQQQQQQQPQQRVMIATHHQPQQYQPQPGNTGKASSDGQDIASLQEAYQRGVAAASVLQQRNVTVQPIAEPSVVMAQHQQQQHPPPPQQQQIHGSPPMQAVPAQAQTVQAQPQVLVNGTTAVVHQQYTPHSVPMVPSQPQSHPQQVHHMQYQCHPQPQPQAQQQPRQQQQFVAAPPPATTPATTTPHPTPSGPVAAPPPPAGGSGGNGGNGTVGDNSEGDCAAVQLVSQFASLAQRLGLSLPQHVLSSLTTAAKIQEQVEQKQQQQQPQQSNGQQQQQKPQAAKPIVQQQPPEQASGPNATPLSAPATAAPAPTGVTPPSPTQSQPKPPPKQDGGGGSKGATSDECAPASIVGGAKPAVTSSWPSNKPQPARAVPSGPGPTAKTMEDTAAAAVEAVDTRAILRRTNSSDSNSGGKGSGVGRGGASSRGEGDVDAFLGEESGAAATSGPGEIVPTALGGAGAAAPQRKRKRPRVDECEAKLNQLKEENRMLKRHLDVVLAKTQTFDNERGEAEKAMRDMIKNGPAGKNQEELGRLVGRFSELYSDYGKTRQQELQFHLTQLQRLAAPTTFTKMSLWTLGQNSQFFENPKRNSLGEILRTELQITPAQAKKIVERNHKIKALSGNIRQTLDLLEKLQSTCEKKQRVFSDRMSKCQKILNPLQVVKLLMWVDDNSRTVEKVCPGWGSERIKATKGGGNAADATADVPVQPGDVSNSKSIAGVAADGTKNGKSGS